MTLVKAQVNKIYRIKEVTEGKARRRLLDMGFTPGVEIYVSQVAPMGGTVLIGVRGFTVALREDAADLIKLEANSAKEYL